MPKKEIMIFLTGLGIGSVGTWLAVKKYYEKRSDDEIRDYKEYKDALESGDVEVNPDSEPNDEVKEPNYQELIQKLNYGSFSKPEKDKEESKKEFVEPSMEERKAPYIIGPDDFAEDKTYDKITLTFFSEDEVFMTVEEEVLQSGMEMIGRENLEHFGEYEPEVLYVRNEIQGADYEVILDERAYADSEYADEDYEAD